MADDAINGLRAEMRDGFNRIETRLGDHDRQFERIETRLDGHDRQFERIEARFKQIDERFDNVDAQFQSLRAEMTAEMKAEGEATRRHFDMVTEHMRDVVKLVAEGTVRNTERLDDHERRLTRIERKSK